MKNKYRQKANRIMFLKAEQISDERDRKKKEVFFSKEQHFTAQI